MQTYKQVLALAALLPLIIASPAPQSTSNNAVEQLADSLENVAGSAVNNLNQNGDGNQAGNDNKNNGNGNGVGAGAGNGNGNNFGNGNNIGAGNNGINLASRGSTSSNPIDSLTEELQNVTGSAVGNLDQNGNNNEAGNGNEGNGNNNGDGAGANNGNNNNFGNGNNIGAGNNGINLRSRQDLGEQLENAAGDAIGNLDQNGGNNEAGNGNKDNGNGNGDGAGANNGNGNTFGNGNNIGSDNNGINLRKVRRNPQGDDTANYVNGVLTASTEGVEGIVDAALPESGGPAETIENAAGNTVENLDVNSDGNSAGNGNTDNGNGNGDGAGANNGNGNTFGNDNNILSNDGGIDVDPTINLRSTRRLARRLPLILA